jgi:phage shock protein A
MQYEYDAAVSQMKDGRQGLKPIARWWSALHAQVMSGRDHVQKLEAQTKAYLKAGERDAAAKFALELQKAKKDLAANEQQLAMHEEAYGNSLKKIQHATQNWAKFARRSRSTTRS